jgi:hypothetical protein
MSTRSVVAKPNGDGFIGRYCHWDGYPSCRGQQIWQTYQELGNAEAVREYALKPDSGGGSWSSYCPPSEVEKREAEKPEYRNDSNETWNTFTQNGDWWIDSNADDCGTEWAYVIGDNHLSVFERRYGKPGQDEGHGTGMFGMGASDTESGGYWGLVGVYNWTGSEPDWNKVEQGVKVGV